MFNWFGNKNDYHVPERTETYDIPNDHAPYTLGLTGDNLVAFKVGYSTITMNVGGVTEMIDQLTMFRDMMIRRTEMLDQEETK